MGAFEFVIALLVLRIVAKSIERRWRSAPLSGESVQVDTEELHRIGNTISELSGRVERLEEERDFYKDLLEPTAASRELPPQDPEP